MKNLKLKIKNSRKSGFSLVELLVVITIIAILSVVAYSALGGQTTNARNSKRLQDLSSIQGALEVHFIQNGEYPTTIGDMSKKVLSKTLEDPWGVPYGYDITASSKSYLLAATIEAVEEGDSTLAYLVGNYEGADCMNRLGASPNFTYSISSPSNCITDGGAILPYTKPPAT